MEKSITKTMTDGVVVFTDLDGTFLDHESYGFEQAMPALQRLGKAGVPVIPVTSKTLSELSLLGLPLDREHQVAENGMAIRNGADVKIQGAAYVEITNTIGRLPQNLRGHIRGFYDMSIGEVVEHTGLTEEQAKAAKTRDASEPFLWSGSDAEMEELKSIAGKSKLSITQGGRFYHLMGQGSKRTAIDWLLNHVFKGEPPVTIALGDGPNDAEMLGFVDYGVIIPNAAGTPVKVNDPKGKIITAPHAGPAGWNAALHTILDELEVSV